MIKKKHEEEKLIIFNAKKISEYMYMYMYSSTFFFFFFFLKQINYIKVCFYT